MSVRPVSIIVVTRSHPESAVEHIRTRTGLSAYDIVASGESGINDALQKSDPAADIVLLEDGISAVEEDWVGKLQAAAYAADDIGVVGCRIVDHDGRLQHAGTSLVVDTFAIERLGEGEKDINQFAGTNDVEGVDFACVYLRRDALNAVGPLDQQYELDAAGFDYCLRVKQHGLRVVCCGGFACCTVSPRQTGTPGVLKRKWASTLSKQRYTNEIGWHSLMNFPTGYAISSRELASALDRNGVHVAYQYVYGPGTLFPPPEPERSETRIADMIRSRPLSADRPQVVYGQGDIFYRNFGAYKIGYTMLETDGIPSEWARQANLMDEVWCPSKFNARTFRNSGVTRPIHVIPLGVDPGYFNPSIRSSRVSERYTFLSVFEWGERKAPELLLRAFNEEFSNDEPVVLICKILNADTTVNVYDEIRRLELNPGGGQIHVSVNHMVPTYQLGVLYRSADCFVLTTRGEGWGMPILEAMACGLPVIATDWSAQCDFMNAANAYPLAVERLVPAVAKCPYYHGFRWAEPSYWDLRRLMRFVSTHREEARAKGERASAEVLSRWTWDNAALQIIARLDAINRGMPI